MLKWIGLLTFGVAVFGISYHYNKRFLDWLRFQSIGTRDYIAEKFSLMFIDIPLNQILLGQFVLSFGLGSIVFLSFLPNFTPGLLFGGLMTVIGWKLPKPIVDWMYERRVKIFVSQMVDALGLMSNGLRSGLSIVQSVGLVTQEMENPIQQEFNLILSENKLGVSVEEAFSNLSKRIDSDDVEMFVTAINILKETGGNLAETFDTIVYTIRERVKLEKKIDAMTAQGFYQGMFVMAIPPIMGFMFYQMDPALMKPMFTHPLGWIILLIIIGLEFIGFLIIRKIIRVEV